MLWSTMTLARPSPQTKNALSSRLAASHVRDRLRSFVTMLIETGARYNTVRTLQWKNIDLTNRCLKFGKDKTASGAGRMIPLNPRAGVMLSFWATNFPDRKPDTPLCLSLREGWPRRGRRLSKGRRHTI